MSRDEFVFTKRAAVAIAAASTLLTAAGTGAFAAWRASAAISSVEAKASDAIMRLESTVHTVNEKVISHTAEDAAWTKAADATMSKSTQDIANLRADIAALRVELARKR